MKRWLLALLLVSGCPGTCQHTTKQGSAFQIQTGKAEVTKRRTDKKGTKTKEYLRKDGTTRLRVTEKSEETERLDRDLLEKMEGASIQWRQDVQQPWWRIPAIVAVSVVASVIVTLLLVWRFSKWKLARLAKWP